MAVPYVLHIKKESLDDLNSYTTPNNPTQIAYIPGVTAKLPQLPLPSLVPIDVNKTNIVPNIQIDNNLQDDSKYNFVYHFLCPPQNVTQGVKRGRKKKKKVDQPVEVKEESTKILKPIPRTRSGRVIRFPKHMEKDFKKVETKELKKSNEIMDNDEEIETSDFDTFKEEPQSKPAELTQLNFHQRKRKIGAQYRCPKCLKAYLGKAKMIQHIKQNPDHGPLPQKETSKVNFDVWNYLVDITHKCSPGQRGIKFCEELTNLLHNVLLLTSALFKKVERNKNFVEVDKVLGNAIGLSPGFYTFNDSELYKDVTVLKLITTTDFFKPVDPTKSKDEVKSENIIENIKTSNSIVKKDEESEPQVKPNKEDVNVTKEEDIRNDSPGFCVPQIEPKIATDLEDIQDDFVKKDESTPMESELLSENSLLHLSNIRTTVEELMLTSVDPGGPLLDNSASSDEVINVDQFVNERFKKITEPDLEVGSSSLNLGLPSLDLFHFHGT